jgi:hypothetical protein
MEERDEPSVLVYNETEMLALKNILEHLTNEHMREFTTEGQYVMSALANHLVIHVEESEEPEFLTNEQCNALLDGAPHVLHDDGSVTLMEEYDNMTKDMRRKAMFPPDDDLPDPAEYRGNDYGDDEDELPDNPK